MSRVEPAARGRVNRVALILIVTGASFVGLTPYALWVERALVLIAFCVGAMLISAWALRSPFTSRRDSPSLWEFLLGFIAATSVTAAVAFLGLILYFAAYWLGRGSMWVASRFGSQLTIDIWAIAFWVSLSIVVGAGIGNVVLALERISKQIYPQTAGLQPDFQTFIRFRRNLALKLSIGAVVLLFGALILVILIPGWRGAWWFDFALAWGLILLGIPLQRVGEHEEVTYTIPSAIDSIEDLFKAGGYAVVRAPRSGRDDLDPLLLDAPDLYAEGPEHAYAIEVKTGRDISKSDPWRDLDDLLSAAWALDTYLKSGGASRVLEVEPLLVYVGPDAPPAVRMYESSGLTKVLWIQDPEILARFRKTKDETARRAMAHDLLRSSIASFTPSTPA